MSATDFRAATAHGSEATLTLAAVLAPERVEAARQRVVRAAGAPGLDGLTVEEMDAHFPALWEPVARSLATGAYRPVPLRRVALPKADGSERLLAIPGVLDRVVQQALHLALAPRLEPTFSQRSFAYRAGLGCSQALAVAERTLGEGADWVLHFDVEKCFDSIPHAPLLQRLEAAALAPEVMRAIEASIRCPVAEGVCLRPNSVGVPQGSPLSPLLANLALAPADALLEGAGWNFVRYADDGLVFARSALEADAARAAVASALTACGLRLHPRKTVATRREEARFLGCAFVAGAGGEWQRVPSAESLATARLRLEELTTEPAVSAEAAAQVVRGYLHGWFAYFWSPAARPILARLAAEAEVLFASAWPGARLAAEVPAARPVGEGRAFPGYGGASGAPARIHWPATLRAWALRAVRSRWIALELDTAPGRRGAWLPRAQGLRLRLGPLWFRFRF